MIGLSLAFVLLVLVNRKERGLGGLGILECGVLFVWVLFFLFVLLLGVVFLQC